jgi:hypothetical protein
MITNRLIRPGKRSDVPVSSLPLPVFGLTLPRRLAAAADTLFASSSSSEREAGLVLSMEALSAFNLSYPRRPSESIESLRFIGQTVWTMGLPRTTLWDLRSDRTWAPCETI